MKNAPMKKQLVYLVLLALAGIGIYLGYSNIDRNTGAKFACGYRPFTQVKTGMDMTEVVQLLGQPTQNITKEELDGNRFGQGELELRIKSGWLYKLPVDWNGGLEVYLDTHGKVIGKNCGNG